MVLEMADVQSPSPAKRKAPVKQTGMLKRAPTGEKFPVITPMSKTTLEENVAFDESHSSSPHNTSESVMGVVAIALKIFW